MMTIQRQNEILAQLCAKIRMVQAAGFTPRLTYRPNSAERARMIRTTGKMPIKRKIGFNIIARAINKAKGREL